MIACSTITRPVNMYYFISACPPIVPGASAGVIYNPYFPEYYSVKKKCDWFIKVPPFEQININFTYIYPYGDCTGHVKIFDMYGKLKRTVTLCSTPVPSSVTYSESVRVRYYPDLDSSSFLAFYQIGYSVPNPVTRYAPPPTPYISHTHCQPYSEKSKLSSFGLLFNKSFPSYLLPFSVCLIEMRQEKIKRSL